MFTLKGNQRTLQALVKSLPWRDVPVADTTIDTGHVRMVVRQLQVAVLAKNLLPDLPGLDQVARPTRQRTYQGKMSTEVVLVITSLPPNVDGPAYLAGLDPWSLVDREQNPSCSGYIISRGSQPDTYWTCAKKYCAVD